MPNGHDANWTRVCAAIDGFRARFGHWPRRVRLLPIAFADVRDHILTAAGFSLVNSVVELVPEEGAAMIADDGAGNEYRYGEEGFPSDEPEPPARKWFGQAIFRPDE